MWDGNPANARSALGSTVDRVVVDGELYAEEEADTLQRLNSGELSLALGQRTAPACGARAGADNSAW
jgi:hypothetical protein